MPCPRWIIAASWGIFGLLATGCESLSRSTDPPQDPLFVLRKPEETKAVTAPPTMLAWTEPALPTLPPELREDRPALADAPAVRKPVPGTLTNQRNE